MGREGHEGRVAAEQHGSANAEQHGSANSEQHGSANAKQQGRVAAEQRGRDAETRIAELYEAGGFRILARRLRTPAGEIDLIAERDGLVAFVEVKRRRRGAAEALGARQRARIIAAAGYWAATHPGHGARGLRFDVVWWDDGRAPVLRADAFRADDG